MHHLSPGRMSLCPGVVVDRYSNVLPYGQVCSAKMLPIIESPCEHPSQPGQTVLCRFQEQDVSMLVAIMRTCGLQLRRTDSIAMKVRPQLCLASFLAGIFTY